MAMENVGIRATVENMAAFKKDADTVNKKMNDIGDGATKAAKQADSGTKSIMGSFKGMAAAIGGLYLGEKLLGGIGDAISGASDLAESQSKVNVVFGESAAAINEFAASAAKNLGMSTQAALESAGTFGNLLSAMGFTDAASADMSKDVLQLGADLGSFNNLGTEEVLEKIRAGLVGEAEPLKSLGVNLSEARIKAEAFSMGLVKANVDQHAMAAASLKVQEASINAGEALKKHGANSIEYAKAQVAVTAAEDALSEAMAGKVPELDARAKAEAAYSIIVKDTAKAQGDFARTSDGLANSQKTLAAEQTNLSNRIGTVFLPAMTGLTRMSIDLLDKMEPLAGAFQAFADAIGGSVKWLQEHQEAQAALAGVLGAVSAAYLLANARMIAYGIATTAVSVATKAVTAAQWLLKAAMSANPIGIVVGLLAGLAAAFVYAWKNSETFRTTVSNAFNAVRDVVASVVDAIGEGLANFVDMTSESANDFIDLINGLLGGVNSLISGFNTLFKTNLGTVAMMDKVSYSGKGVRSVLKGMSAGIKTWAIDTGMASRRTTADILDMEHGMNLAARAQKKVVDAPPIPPAPDGPLGTLKQDTHDAGSAVDDLDRKLKGIGQIKFTGETAIDDQIFELEQQRTALELAIAKLGPQATTEAKKPFQDQIDAISNQIDILSKEAELKFGPLQRMFDRLLNPPMEASTQAKLDAILALDPGTLAGLDEAAKSAGLTTKSLGQIEGFNWPDMTVWITWWNEIRDRTGEIVANIRNMAMPDITDLPVAHSGSGTGGAPAGLSAELLKVWEEWVASGGNAQVQAFYAHLHALGIPGFARGVKDFVGGLAMVGERGPELVNLPRGSNVYNTTMTRQLMPAGVGARAVDQRQYNDTYNINGAQQPVDVWHTIQQRQRFARITQGR